MAQDTKETWIEVALNGPWGKMRQPTMPIAVEDIIQEGIDAAKAGAGIVHFHAYDVETGIQKDEWQIYARIIEGIRAKVDVIAYPTVPLAGSALTGEAETAEERYRHVDELGRRGLLEWAVVDPGSVNFTRFDADRSGEASFIYLNPEDHVREGMRACVKHGIRPSFAIYEPGFARLGANLASKFPGLKRPVYRWMFSDEFAWGFPPKSYGLDAYLALLSDLAPGSPWMVAGLGVDVEPLIPETLARGGHLRIGLEDAHLHDGRSNAQILERALRLLAKKSATSASPASIRASLAEWDRGAA
jgi:3-keto-5-aminohexanoate cleavage enzyme